MPTPPDSLVKPQPLVEDVDYYLEKGFFVFTEYFLRKRGFCCGSGCRHCPYSTDEAGKTAFTRPELKP